jgi:hypothetical protein
MEDKNETDPGSETKRDHRAVDSGQGNNARSIFMGKRMLVILIILMSIFAFTSGVFIYQYTQTLGEYRDLQWCFDEYTGVDRSIIQCIEDQEGTLNEFLGVDWNHKAWLLAQGGCRCHIWPDMEGCA